MASQSLYRKWRSQTFDEMVGQEPIIRTLKNALQADNLSHAYLFTGPRGTGKTSTARLLAKTVNCTNPHDGEPCNECSQCREITAGNSFNVIEIDAASNRGIDSIRELREKVMMPPSTGKYKIYILDEAHMLTTEAFNALLKTLEEPPDYAIFVMATTDVHKMLPTVLSRCQRFDFKRISTRQIVNHLLFVAEKEQVALEKSAAELLARTAAGGMRDALSLLDQAIAYAGTSVSLAQVQAMLGVADPRAISRLIGSIAQLDSPALLYLIHELAEAGADLRQVNAQIADYWRALMLAKAGADIATIMDLTEDEVREVHELVPAFTLEELTECARLFAQNDLVQRNQGTPQLGLELASLECVELHARAQSGGPLLREQSPATLTTLRPAQAPASSSSTHMASTPMPATEAKSEPRKQNAIQHDRTPVPPAFSPSPSMQALPEHETHPAEHPAPLSSTNGGGNRHGLTLSGVRASWENVKRRTMQRSNLLGTYVGLCDAVGVEEEDATTVIVIQAAQARHLKVLKEGEHPKDIEWALSTEFSQPCKVRILPPGQTYTGPRAQNSLGTLPPASSAYRAPAPSTDEPPMQHEPAISPVVETPHEPNRQTQPPGNTQPSRQTLENRTGYDLPAEPPLARPQPVSENTHRTLSADELGQKARQDPVVQEFMKMFQANIVTIRPT
jgi:DNA polymerase-3 subunit gamma/tau